MTHDKPNLSPKIALYEPDIPQNTASIVRTCSCLGAQLEIIEPCGFLFTDKRFKRVVMDYLEEDKIYLSVKFTAWSSGAGNGQGGAGGFAYQRSTK